MQFRVKTGIHIEAGRQYEQGQIVESDRNLAIVFRGKFDPVDGTGQVLPGPMIQVEGPKTVVAPDLETPQEPPAPAEAVPSTTMQAIHKGGGKWVVVNKETGIQINVGFMTKAEAEHLVAAGLSEETPVVEAGETPPTPAVESMLVTPEEKKTPAKRMRKK